MAFLHPAAFLHSHLGTFGFVHPEGSFHPLNALCVHTALLLSGCRALATLKTVPRTWGVPKPELHLEIHQWSKSKLVWLWGVHWPDSRKHPWSSAGSPEAALVLDRESQKEIWGFSQPHYAMGFMGSCASLWIPSSQFIIALMGCCSHCWLFFLSPRPQTRTSCCFCALEMSLSRAGGWTHSFLLLSDAFQAEACLNSAPVLLDICNPLGLDPTRHFTGKFSTLCWRHQSRCCSDPDRGKPLQVWE